MLYLIVLIDSLNLETMKKLFAVLMLSTFALGAFAATETPAMKQDTTKKHKMKKDTSMKRDTSKKPPKK